MYEYSHGGNAAFEKGKKSIIDLSANINPLGMPAGVRRAIISGISDCIRYPDNFSRELAEKIGEFENTEPEWIFCAGGASDIIFRLPKGLRAKKVMITAPAFSDYERSAAAEGAEIVRHGLLPEYGFEVGKCILDEFSRKKPDLVFICNPNNPTGKLVSPDLIRELLELGKESGAIVAVDECFLDFAAEAGEYTSKGFINDYPNLIVLKAFTKVFAMPGIRLGYALCSDLELIKKLYYSGADWPVSNLAQRAGIAALENGASYIRKTVDFVSSERELMERELTMAGFRVFPSAANYVFLQSPFNFDLWSELDMAGIRIRPCGNYHGLDGSYFRIAVSNKENNRKLLSAVERIRNEKA